MFPSSEGVCEYSRGHPAAFFFARAARHAAIIIRFTVTNHEAPRIDFRGSTMHRARRHDA
ncbi:hypothetical protein WT83_05245 [Burkholderia territorii]|uniref:Uncharacterized protein n=1 Tax=Burkholderia territorii TaxID=1503055 RepID=A0A108F1Q8_9BURK|nr:hypothetical protein WT83_05245 [Burkholderia territorii]